MRQNVLLHIFKSSVPKYADDGKDNVIDDYCALMGASELLDCNWQRRVS